MAMKLFKPFLNSRSPYSIYKCFRHNLPQLPYPYDGLEPIICQELVELHYDIFHRAYVKNLNITLERLNTAFRNGDLNAIISLQPSLKFNGGGHINHTILWSNLSPNGSPLGCPSDLLLKGISDSFHSIDILQEKMVLLCCAIESSGWVWLGYNPYSKLLQLATCKSENPLRATTGLIPLIGIDMWEHAFYVQYKNNKEEYARSLFEIINWNDINRRYEEAQATGVVANANKHHIII